MKVYMFQTIYENHNNCDFDTKEELFYKEDDALEYMRVAIEEELRSIRDMYCDDDEDPEDYCEITELGYDHVTIYMEDEFWLSFEIHEKTIMNFN